MSAFREPDRPQCLDLRRSVNLKFASRQCLLPSNFGRGSPRCNQPGIDPAETKARPANLALDVLKKIRPIRFWLLGLALLMTGDNWQDLYR
jgi:hypothetical protein